MISFAKKWFDLNEGRVVHSYSTSLPPLTRLRHVVRIVLYNPSISKWPKTCPHPAVIAEKGQLARLRAWRRQGERDATATLALLGKHVVEGVYRDNWDSKDHWPVWKECF